MEKLNYYYRSAISLELLHDFLLVHDDIIDKSATRRGKPSMHEMLNKYLINYKNIKFSGQDLAIVIGDVMYAMSLHAFLSIKEMIKNIKKACVVVQSTQNLNNVLKIVGFLKSFIKELKFFNTICKPTRMKQEEIRKMPRENDVN